VKKALEATKTQKNKMGISLFQHMKIYVIAFNILAASVIFCSIFLTHELYVLSATNMYVALDRAKIIDRERLKEVYSLEFENDRILIPKKYMNKKLSVYWIGIPCAIAFTLNAIFIWTLWPKK
jgi:hypothetical protein